MTGVLKCRQAVRGASDLGLVPFVIPGARLISSDEIDARHMEIPRDRDVVAWDVLDPGRVV